MIVGCIFTLSNVFISLQNNHVDFNQMSMGEKPFLFIYGGTIGSLGLIMLIDALTQSFSCKGLCYWGKNSLIIMCIHTALGFKKIALKGWEKTAYIPKTANLEYIIECLMVLVILSMLMYACIEIINTHLHFLTKKPAMAEKQD